MEERRIKDCATQMLVVSQLFAAHTARLLDPYGMTPVQLRILRLLAKGTGAEGMRVSDLAVAAGVGQPAVTKVVAKFAAQGLVHLSPDQQDQRAKRVAATEQAGALIAGIQDALAPEMAKVFSGFSPGELWRFTALLSELEESLRQGQPGAGAGISR